MSSEPVCAYPKLKQQQKIRFREKPALFEQKKLAPVLVKNWFGFWKTGSVVGKSVTDMGKSATDFGKKNSSIFGKNRFGLWDKLASVLGKKRLDLGGNWFGFWIGWGRSSSLIVLNA